MSFQAKICWHNFAVEFFVFHTLLTPHILEKGIQWTTRREKSYSFGVINGYLQVLSTCAFLSEFAATSLICLQRPRLLSRQNRLSWSHWNRFYSFYQAVSIRLSLHLVHCSLLWVVPDSSFPQLQINRSLHNFGTKGKWELWTKLDLLCPYLWSYKKPKYCQLEV